LVADAMYVTIQKEVADRMTARAGTADYGILSVLLAATGNAQIIRKLGRDVFWPRPQVDSAMVAFVRDAAGAARISDIRLFCDILSLLLGHRRKMLKAAAKLAEGRLASAKDWPGIFDHCRIDPKIRPQQLTAEQFVALANACVEALAGS
jgi:16S rRNA (adenine1518-N6/adenine1519-N6)-dimethyltransferase